MEVARGRGKGSGELLFDGCGVAVTQDEAGLGHDDVPVVDNVVLYT